MAIARDQGGPRPRVALGGVLVDRVDRATAAATVASFLRDGGRHQIATVNVDFVRRAQQDSGFRAVINQADLAIADGMPLVWLSRLRGEPIPERVAGVDLMDDCCRLAQSEGLGIFLLGAAPGIANRAASALRARHAGLSVLGTYSPPFGAHTPANEYEMVERVRAAGRSVLFVAFGAPRQDQFIRTHLGDLDVPVAMGVGCAFDLLAGVVRRAPVPLQAAGFEWAWRLAQEPRRLWRRYLVEDVPLLGVLAAAAVRDGVRTLAGIR